MSKVCSEIGRGEICSRRNIELLVSNIFIFCSRSMIKIEIREISWMTNIILVINTRINVHNLIHRARTIYKITIYHILAILRMYYLLHFSAKLEFSSVRSYLFLDFWHNAIFWFIFHFKFLLCSCSNSVKL